MSISDLLNKLLTNQDAAAECQELAEKIKRGEIKVDLIAQELQHLLGHLQQWAQQNPAMLFAILRQVRPICITPKLVYVTRFDDVCEVLSRPETYHVIYGPSMRAMTGGGDFFLGMQDTPAYTRDTSLMRLAVRREDIPDRIDPYLKATAERIVKDAGSSIDMVQKLTRVVPVRWVAKYFGIQPVDETQFVDDCHAVFHFLFIPPATDEVKAAAAAAAPRLNTCLDQAIEQRKASGRDEDDVLGRCLKMQTAGLPGTSDVEIRNNLFGIIVGSLPGTSKAVVNIIQQLLERPAELAAAQAAAKANDLPKLCRIVFEALRFEPINPGLLRIAAKDDVLALGTNRATKIPAGSIVMVATQSAMMDEAELDSPQEFRLDRPDHHYLHFGHGMHTCFGQHINRVQIPRMAQALLAKSNLRRVPGESGRLKMRGVFPWSMSVEFDP